MKITVVGATGTAGSQIVKEALSRGHEVTAIARTEEKLAALGADANLTIIAKDAFDLTKEELATADVVVHALSMSPDKAYLQTDLATRWVSYFRETESPRLFFVLGAGSLVTGEDKHFVIEDIRPLPDSDAWIAIPQNQFYELNFLRDVHNVDWVGVSPGFIFQAGDNEEFILGEDELLFSENGESVTDSRALGIAIVDEIENRNFVNKRFHVVNK
jgi:putative NADH-flavin reductase